MNHVIAKKHKNNIPELFGCWEQGERMEFRHPLKASSFVHPNAIENVKLTLENKTKNVRIAETTRNVLKTIAKER